MTYQYAITFTDGTSTVVEGSTFGEALSQVDTPAVAVIARRPLEDAYFCGHCAATSRDGHSIHCPGWEDHDE